MASRPAPRTGPRGVDTHLDLHLGCGPGSPRAALDPRGSRLDPGRCRPGELGRTPGAGGPIGVEATGTYRAGRLARADGLHVVQVNRPTGACGGDTARRIRSTLRPRPGRPRPEGHHRPKTRAGQVELIRVRGGSAGARKARVAAAEPRSGLLSSAPEELGRPRLGRTTRPGRHLGRAAARALDQGHGRDQGRPGDPGRRWHRLQAELTQLEEPVTTAPRHRWPWPGSGSTPPGSCWSPPAAPPWSGWVATTDQRLVQRRTNQGACPSSTACPG